jgi:RimJ/RimL family protein N-acetyltransferase
MKIKKNLNFRLGKKLCTVRSIRPNDVSHAYLKAIKNDEYIKGRDPSISLSDQKEYVDNVTQSSVRFLNGLFVDGILVGSSGMQISSGQAALESIESTVGIIIFEEENRGKGYGKVLVWAGIYLMSLVEGIHVYRASILSANERSMRTFISCGFQVEPSMTEEALSIAELNISDLKRPEIISQVTLVNEIDHLF